jgi:hypothetical protein
MLMSHPPCLIFLMSVMQTNWYRIQILLFITHIVPSFSSFDFHIFWSRFFSNTLIIICLQEWEMNFQIEICLLFLRNCNFSNILNILYFPNDNAHLMYTVHPVLFSSHELVVDKRQNIIVCL